MKWRNSRQDLYNLNTFENNACVYAVMDDNVTSDTFQSSNARKFLTTSVHVKWMIYFCSIVRFCTCRLWGDPHHWTFDGRSFTFHGDCEYILSQHTDVQSQDSGLQSFQLFARYRKRRPTDRITYVSSLRLEYSGRDFKLHNQQLYVNGALTVTPYISDSVSITLRADDAFVSIFIKF